MSANGDDHALSDVTNKVSNVQINEAALERVKEANWSAPQGFDYAKYNAGPRDKTAPAPESGQPEEESSSWAANAAKYEWQDEYGDVGPEHKELRDILFGHPDKMQQGEELSK